MQQGKINETLFHSCLSFYIKLIKTGEKQKNSGYDLGGTKEMYRPFFDSGRKRRNAEMEKEHEIRVLMVEPNEHPKEFLLEKTLQAMQKAVGGLIDIVGIDDDGTCLLLNDEGKLIGLEGNRRIGDDVIVGNFYVCGSNEDGELASLTEAEMEKYKERFWEPEEITQEEIDAACKAEICSIDFLC